MEKIIIAAVSKNNVIGEKGKLPWHNQEELRHFRNTTTGFPVIMGRKTWEAIAHPLDNRLNIILTKNHEFSFTQPNVIVCRSIGEALSECSKRKSEKIFFIGGAEIFEQTINLADRIILSRMNFETEGDKFFVTLDLAEWMLERTETFTEFKVDYYIRRQKNEIV